LMKLSQEDYEAFQRRYKKERVLMELFARDTSFPGELAKLTGAPVEEVERLLEELVSDKLVENIAAKYFKLTYEGYSWAKSQMKMKW
jgi:predicted transcriptional regulator